MDKSWMNLEDKDSNEYRACLKAFLDFAFERASVNGKIHCPCKRCVNRKWQSREYCEYHLVRTGFLDGYTHWIKHGERTSQQNPIRESSQNLNMGHNQGGLSQNCNLGSDIVGLLRDVFFQNSEFIQNEHVGASEGEDAEPTQPMDGMESELNELNEQEHVMETERETNEPLDHQNKGNSKDFFKILEDYKKELFPGCPISKLSALLQLMHLKCLKGLDAECFEMLLQFLVTLVPGIDIPVTYYECKKLIKGLGLGYEKIHACPNNCMLFWKESANEEVCHVCHASRWQLDEAQTRNKKAKRIPAKVLRYFPLISRLQRLFMSTKTANDMRWHAEKRVKDGKLRHPADGEAWKAFDARYQDLSMVFVVACVV